MSTAVATDSAAEPTDKKSQRSQQQRGLATKSKTKVQSSTGGNKPAGNARRLVQTQLMLSPVAETAPTTTNGATTVVLIRRGAQCSPVKSARLELLCDEERSSPGNGNCVEPDLADADNGLANGKLKEPTRSQLKPKPASLRRSKSCDTRQAAANHCVANSTASSASSSSSSTSSSTMSSNNLGKSTSLENFFPSLAAGTRRSERRLLKAAQNNSEADTIDRITRVSQDGLKIVDFPDKGRGIVSTRAFSRDEFVVEYKGDLIDFKAAKQREQAYNSDPTVGCYMYYFVARGVKLCVDATAESPYYGRLLNHSRLTPNCYTKVVCIGERTHLCLFAKRDISPGEELVYDYGDRDPATLAAHPWLKC